LCQTDALYYLCVDEENIFREVIIVQTDVVISRLPCETDISRITKRKIDTKIKRLAKQVY